MPSRLTAVTPEVAIPVADQKDCGLWERDCALILYSDLTLLDAEKWELRKFDTTPFLLTTVKKRGRDNILTVMALFKGRDFRGKFQREIQSASWRHGKRKTRRSKIVIRAVARRATTIVDHLWRAAVLKIACVSITVLLYACFKEV